ncbi:F0F1 ATP synthase subunit B [Paenibacillus antri]|uniref:ATP synthase subunit b n=1 Tax=Paenibacillus antri TaxID=2582848 RepID=A0A5R9G644_9BACL|nr:F0F1 ATP synthase subunit B [Paenibacillus antri]TLS50519.1 F0F1 ATP synthase subunit B [Paenibacillus antri]
MEFVWTSTVITIVAFVLLYLLLNKYAFGPLFNIMEQRKQLVVGELQQAEANRKESAALLEEQRKAIEQARKEAQDIVEQTRKVSTKTAEEIVETAKNEAVRLKQAAQEDIVSEKNQAIAELRKQVGEMSVKIASKIIEKEVDASSQEALVDKYLKEVGSR